MTLPGNVDLLNRLRRYRSLLLLSFAPLILAGMGWCFFSVFFPHSEDKTDRQDLAPDGSLQAISGMLNRETTSSSEKLAGQAGHVTRPDTHAAISLTTHDGSATFATSTTQARFDEDKRLVNPRLDGWQSEAFNEDAGAQLNKIGKLLLQPKLRSKARLTDFVTDEFYFHPLRPQHLAEVYRDKLTTVRWAVDGEPDVVPDTQGAAALTQALAAFDELFDQCDTAKSDVKFKVIHVDLSDGVARTSAKLEARCMRNDSSVFVTATWQCQWDRSSNAAPRLTSIEVDDYEEVTTSAPNGTWFADCTESVLANNRSFREQLVYGTNHWSNIIDKTHLMELFSWYGMAVGDTNGDGLEDVYVCQGGGLPNRLFVQNPDGSATDRSTWAGVDWLDLTRSALIIDLDNDSDQDMVIGLPSAVLVMLNDGTGRFQLEQTIPARHPDIQSITAADYDLDGDLDIYVGIARQTGLLSPQSTGEFVFHDANDGGENRLYRNDLSAAGSLQLVDVTDAVGLNVHNRRHTLAVAWEDYDSDGDSDIYVANDYGQNCLYRNDAVDGGRQFYEVAAKAGVLDQGSGMSASWGDYNRDGNMDLYVANMFSSAGNRITAQSQFVKDVNRNLQSVYRRFAKGNTLFAGLGDGTFREVTDAAVEMGRWAWSSLFADINNDGWEDLLVANGFVTSSSPEDL